MGGANPHFSRKGRARNGHPEEFGIRASEKQVPLRAFSPDRNDRFLIMLTVVLFPSTAFLGGRCRGVPHSGFAAVQDDNFFSAVGLAAELYLEPLRLRRWCR